MQFVQLMLLGWVDWYRSIFRPNQDIGRQKCAPTASKDESHSAARSTVAIKTRFATVYRLLAVPYRKAMNP